MVVKNWGEMGIGDIFWALPITTQIYQISQSHVSVWTLCKSPGLLLCLLNDYFVTPWSLFLIWKRVEWAQEKWSMVASLSHTERRWLEPGALTERVVVIAEEIPCKNTGPSVHPRMSFLLRSDRIPWGGAKGLWPFLFPLCSLQWSSIESWWGWFEDDMLWCVLHFTYLCKRRLGLA